MPCRVVLGSPINLDIVPSNMSKKRKEPPLRSPSTSDSKRSRSSLLSDADDDDKTSNRAPRPRVDPTYGQRGAFPGLDHVSNDGLFYGPASDGLEYLRMVR